MDNMARLIEKKYTTDADGIIHLDSTGNPIYTESARDIYVSVESIRESTYFEAGQQGLVPEHKLVTFYLDYQGEDEIEYLGVRYSIFRNYLVPGTERMELYLTRKAGVSDVAESIGG